jgi:predicted methyltransferase
MTDLQKLVETWTGETCSGADGESVVFTDHGLEAFARLAMQYAAEEAAKVCEERAASHEEDAELEKDERYAVHAKHERRCAAAIRERFKT